MKFKFIDLFAGIGGFHIACHNLGGECVFAAEWDKSCRKTYQANFKDIAPKLFDSEGNATEYYAGDITQYNPQNIPDHDIVFAGFPCQPFSQAGLKKGFDDTRGTLFFNIANIIMEKRPKAVFLENVRGLLKHDNGNTFEVIKNTINELGYTFHYRIIKASDFNLPQHRPRLYMVCFRNDLKDTFDYPQPVELTMSMSDVFEANVEKKIGFTIRVGGKGSPINDRRNWDGYIVDGVERRLSLKEGRRMQGFSDNFVFPVSNTQAMKQLGNSVAIPAVQAVVAEILKVLERN